MDLLKQLVSVPSAPGDETATRDFIISYVQQHSSKWKVQPQIIYGDGFQDCLVLCFGSPRVAVFAHMDTVAWMAGYENRLLEMGSPEGATGDILVGTDSGGPLECPISVQKNKVMAEGRLIDRGTPLTYKPFFETDGNEITATYLDNRAGIYTALRLAETLEHGLLVFTCWEEHAGGTVGYMARYIIEKYAVLQTLISDITWATRGIHMGQGPAISLRDAGIPRRAYIRKVLDLAAGSGVPYQMEVEQYGSSDGGELQRSPYPIDWCFIGPPAIAMHTSRETLHTGDLEATLHLYRYLMEKM